MKKKHNETARLKAMALLRKAAISNSPAINRSDGDKDDLPELSERVRHLLDILEKQRPPTNMIFFVMYDIESDKVRRAVAKYLLAKGCSRVQKSIFLADLPGATCRSISQDLAEVQALYDNKDSILIVPLSMDYINSMKIIGQNINLDLILKNKTTLFF